VVAGHCGIADREDQQDQTHHDVRRRDARAVAKQHRDWRAAGHCSQWRGGRDDEEGNGEHSEATVPQLL